MDALIYEYSENANPSMSPIPVGVFSRSMYEKCDSSRIIHLESNLAEYPCTSPNLLANFIIILPHETLICDTVNCTSHLFYVIRGEGSASTHERAFFWSSGDLFVVPGGQPVSLTSDDSRAVLYWVHDAPLLSYLGVWFGEPRFSTSFFSSTLLYKNLDKIRHDIDNHTKNRLGILLSNEKTDHSTRTITHVLWCLLNCLPRNSAQRPHRHNSVAIDLCVSGGGESVYTLMGPELDENGWVKDPKRVNWEDGSAFITPSGWYHSHHNESTVDAIVLPVQDAGLYTYQRTLDIRFA